MNKKQSGNSKNLSLLERKLRKIIREELSEAKYSNLPSYSKGWAILPAGRLNLSTGKTKYFNVLEDRSALIVIQFKRMPGSDIPDKYMVIAGAGSPDGYEKTQTRGYHDQTGREFPPFDVIGRLSSSESSLKKIKDRVSKTSVSFAVFK